MKLNDKTILIVGASQGIGREVALQLAKRGNRLVLTARNQAGLTDVKQQVEAAGSKCVTVEADATDAALAQKVIDKVVEQFGALDVVLINAGGAWPIELQHSTVAEQQEIYDWNIKPVINHFMPAMKVMMTQKQGGVIATTNSLASFQGLPFTAAYSGSKAAIRLFFDGARAELKRHKVRPVVICPGFVSTRAHADGKAPTPFIITPQQAAKKVIRAIECEKRYSLFPWPLALSTRLGALTPAWLLDFIMSRQKLND